MLLNNGVPGFTFRLAGEETSRCARGSARIRDAGGKTIAGITVNRGGAGVIDSSGDAACQKGKAVDSKKLLRCRFQNWWHEPCSWLPTIPNPCDANLAFFYDVKKVRNSHAQRKRHAGHLWLRRS